jgi:predicted 2-oxoglutarate/Fe(II)-dependent dioxygenase YbiX
MEIIDHGHDIIEYRNAITNPYALIADIEELDSDRGVYQVLPKFTEWKEGYTQPDGVWRAVNVKGRNKVFRWNESLQVSDKSARELASEKVIDPIVNPIIKCSNDYAEKVGIPLPNTVSKNVDLRVYATGENLGVHEDTNHGEPATTHSLVIYLNDDYEGGEINFPNIGLKIKPQAGSIVAFPATTPHESMKVTKGEKWHSPYFWYSSIGLITSGKEAPSIDRFRPTTNIALIGFGLVGREVYRQLTNHPDYESKFIVSRIQVLNSDIDRGVQHNGVIITNDLASLQETDIYNTVIDCSEYTPQSKDLITNLLKRKINLHTCSKGLVEENWQELVELAKASGSTITFNSIPASATLEKYKGIDLTDKNFSEHNSPDLYIFRGAGPKETASYIVNDVLNQATI